ncbi:hypothetical protein CF326_g665 [Tilletia indica]|nr:hypothetical protein CF326_g665 [Tilletia indica]
MSTRAASRAVRVSPRTTTQARMSAERNRLVSMKKMQLAKKNKTPSPNSKSKPAQISPAAAARAARAARRGEPEAPDGEDPDDHQSEDDSDLDRFNGGNIASDSDSDLTEYETNFDTDSDEEQPSATPDAVSKKRKQPPSSSSPRTPSKKSRISALLTPPSSSRSGKSTPAKLRNTMASPKRRAKEITSAFSGYSPGSSSSTLITPSQRDADKASVTLPYLASLTPQQRAKRLLHVGLTPDKLPCREGEFQQIYTSVEDALQERVGQCIYVSGVPGTGKTATVRSVVRELTTRADAGRIDQFNFVEINGMKLGDPAQVYTMLWQAIRPDPEGRRPSPKFALAALNSYFSKRKPGVGPPSPGRWRVGNAHTSSAQRPTVVLMDELDQLVNARQDVIYNLFSWPNAIESQLIVIAVANTMDLPERTFKPKVASRLGLTRIPFETYSRPQLQEIIQTRLGIGAHDPKQILQALEADPRVKITPRQRSLAGLDAAAKKGCADLLHPDAIKLAAHRVASISGDARRMLDVCRRVIEAVEGKAEMLVEKERSDGQGNEADARRSHRQTAAAAVVHAKAVSDRCQQATAKDVIAVFDSMVKSGTARHIASLSLSAKVLLVAMIRYIRRSGLVEVRVGDVLVEQTAILNNHGINIGIQGKGEQGNGWQDWDVVPNMAELDWALASLCRAGLVGLIGSGAGPGRAGINGRLSLLCKEDDIRLALQTSTDERLKAVL